MEGFHFAAPWFVLGALAVGIPFLMLLTKAKAFAVVPFSSIQFLQTLTRRAANTIEWKRLLLLVSRITVMGVLPLAFALPFFYQGAWGKDGMKTTHWIFVLDDSYSMDYRDGTQTLFELAKRRILERAKTEFSKDHHATFSLYRFDTGIYPVFEKSSNLKVFEHNLSQVRDTRKSSDFSRLKSGLREILQKNRAANQCVVIVSDFAIDDDNLRKEYENAKFAKDFDAATETLVIRPGAYQNFTVEKILFPPRPFLVDVEEDVRVLYRFAGYDTPGTVILNLFVDDGLAASVKVKVTGRGEGAARFKHRFQNPGSYALRAESSADPLTVDNGRLALACVEQQRRVLLIEDQKYRYPFESPNFFLTQAIQSDEKSENGTSWVSVSGATSNEAAQISLDDFHLIVLTDMTSYDARLLNQLRYYVKNGGKVLFALGKNFQAPQVNGNSTLVRFLGGSFAVEENRPKDLDPFHPVMTDRFHPMFRAFDGLRGKGLERVAFWKFAPFIPAEGGDYRALLVFNGVHPLLMERTEGKGKIFIWTSSLNSDWNDFPKDPLFVPFAYELLKYAMNPDLISVESLSAGEKLELRFENSGSRILLKTPSQETLKFFDKPRTNVYWYELEQPGFYECYYSKGQETQKRAIVVNVNPRESSASFAKVEGVGVKKTAVRRHTAANLSDRKKQKTFLYMPLFQVVLFLLLAESYLANRFYQTRKV